MNLNEIKEKLNEIKNENTKRFVENIIKYYQESLAFRRNKEIEEYIFETTYVGKEDSRENAFIVKIDKNCSIEKELEKIDKINKSIKCVLFEINLDEINANKYINTKRIIKFEGILKSIQESTNIKKDIIRILRQEYQKNNVEQKNKIELEKGADIIIEVAKIAKEKGIDIGKNGKIIVLKDSENKTKEKEFIINQLEKIVKVINLNKINEKYTYIYEDACKTLDKDFIESNFCDFINNKCVAQRAKRFYPINKKDGCCFMMIRKCTHLVKEKNKATCNTSCLACKLFSCPYLSKMGVKYYPKENILLEKFLDKGQRHKMVFNFYETKGKMIEELIKLEKH